MTATDPIRDLEAQLHGLRGVVDDLKNELFPAARPSTGPATRSGPVTRSSPRATSSKAQQLFEQFERMYSQLELEIKRFKAGGNQTSTSPQLPEQQRPTGSSSEPTDEEDLSSLSSPSTQVTDESQQSSHSTTTEAPTPSPQTSPGPSKQLSKPTDSSTASGKPPSPSDKPPSSDEPSPLSASSSSSTTGVSRIETPGEVQSIPGRSFSISRHEMGELLIPKLVEIVNQGSFSESITVQGSPLDVVNMDYHAISYTSPDHRGNAYRALRGKPGCVRLETTKTQSHFNWPDFSQVPQRPTYDEMYQFVEATVSEPAKAILPYYGGLASVPFDTVLHPGETLAKCDCLEIANSEYYHIGVKGSGTCFHREDANFWSCNLTESGWKIFIFIKAAYTEKFEAFVRRTWPECRKCDQFVRHLNLLIAPSRLSDEDIGYEIKCAGPGDLIITKPGLYHACINYSACFARSINFLLPEEPFLPDGMSVCEDCGLYNLRADYDIDFVPALTDGNKRKAASSLLERAPKTRRAQTGDISRAIAFIKQADPLCPVPDFDIENPPALGILRVAASVRSRQAIHQFVSLVEAWRKAEERLPLPSGDAPDLLKFRMRCIQRHEKSELFSKFQLRVQRMALARDLEALKGWNMRHSPETITKICEDVGWTREQLKYNRAQGQKWKRICGRFIGILPFILLNDNLFEVKTCDFDDWKDAGCHVFHSLLDDANTKTLCMVGAAFEKSLRDGLPVKFAWEGQTVDWYNASWDEVATLLAVKSS